MSDAVQMRLVDGRQIGRLDEGALIGEYEETLSTAGNGSSVLIPAGAHNVTVTLSFEGEGASGKVQATTDPVQKVLDDEATWVDWPHGEVSDMTQDRTKSVTALRQVCVNPESTLTIRAA